MLGDCYLEPSSALGRARRRRDRCVLELLGAEWDGDQIANRDAIVEQIAAQVADFAETYYLTIEPAGATTTQLDAMQRDARQVSEDFVAGLTR